MASTRLLFIGDIVARPGRRAVESILPQLKESQKIDVVIANVENLAGGKGVTAETVMQMINAGVDYFTSGDHVFHNPGYEEVLDDDSFGVVRPLNLHPSLHIAGKGFITFTVNDQKFMLCNLLGQDAMRSVSENPFLTMETFLESNEVEEAIILLDFHAERTSEKKAMGFFLDGKVSVVVGTHTHVPSADLQVLPGGTFYATDLGMTGAFDSVLGVKKDIIIRRFMYPYSERFEWEYGGDKVFNSVLIELGESGKIKEFERIDRTIP